jgi:DNA-binding MarR family transcriptional regulator/N-acetylglutamate synthase-like GNAT family acetyltransferase
MADADVAQVRRFNRIAGERIGALQGNFLGLRRPIGEARLLWEIGLDGAGIRELRARLGLDSGYASRLLRSLEDGGLVAVTPDTTDGRVRRVVLTARGRREWRELESRSDELAVSVLTPLNERQRAQLVDAMATVERLLTASMITTELVSPRNTDARYCLNEYFRELDARFDFGFDPERSIPADSLGLFLVARLRGRPVGCGGLKLEPRQPAYLKRMWVSPDLRGVGLGKRLLRELEERALEHGANAVQLETNRTLTEAISLYRACGYEEVEPFNDEPYAHHWFEKRLTK